MDDRPSLAVFAETCRLPEDRIDLGAAALQIAESEYPGLDSKSYLDRFDEMATSVAERRRSGRGVLGMIYDEFGFSGNQKDYYDPKNSYLNEVLDRRLGIPISLALVVIETARRLGIPAEGVGFPGHFLVRLREPVGRHEETLVDPFDGSVLSPPRLRGLFKRVTGEDRDPPSELLEPLNKRQILFRMLANLRGIYEHRSDGGRLRNVLLRMSILAPENQEIRQQLDQLGGGAPVGDFRFLVN